MDSSHRLTQCFSTPLLPFFFSSPSWSLIYLYDPPLFVDAVSYLKNYFISTLLNYILDSYIIPNNLTVMQQQKWERILCLSLFSNIFLILKPCLRLKRKLVDFSAAGYAGDKGTFDSVLNFKYEYYTRAVKFRWPI
jgi:hypothetical protein